MSARVVSKENLVKTWTPRVAIGGGHSYGLGPFSGDVIGRHWLFRDDNGLGSTNAMTFLPDLAARLPNLHELSRAGVVSGPPGTEVGLHTPIPALRGDIKRGTRVCGIVLHIGTLRGRPGHCVDY